MIATSVTLYITKLNTTQKQTHKNWMVVLKVTKVPFLGYFGGWYLVLVQQKLLKGIATL
jgi:hypothetical protein